MLLAFVPEPELSDVQRKLKNWLVHCVHKAYRHYHEARNLVVEQLDEAKRPLKELAKGRQLPIVDFALEMEDCITSLDKAAKCVQKLAKAGLLKDDNLSRLTDELQALRDFRNAQEHMYERIASEKSGPTMVMNTEDGQAMQLLESKVNFHAVCSLLEAVFLDVAAMFPMFDPDAGEVGNARQRLALSASVKVTSLPIERDGS